MKAKRRYVGGLEGALEDGDGMVLGGDIIEAFGAAAEGWESVKLR